MKKLHYFSLFLLLIFSCQKKFEYDYTFIAEIPAYNVDKAILVLTDTDGKILGDIDLPKSGSEIRQTFTMRLKEPLETYDVHVIMTNNLYVEIKSHIGVSNSGSIVFDAPFRPFTPTITKNVKVTVPGTFHRVAGVNSASVPQSGDQTLLNMRLQENQGLFIENNRNDSTKRGILYLNHNQVKDTILKEQDFKEVVKTLDIKNEHDHFMRIKKIYAVSPDEKEFLCLFERYSEVDNIPIAIPEKLDPNWRYYVLYDTYFYVFHRFYDQKSKIDLDPPRIEITSEEVKNDKISIYTKGPVDFLTMNISAIDTIKIEYISWSLQGNPKRFESYNIPDLRKYIDANFQKLYSDIFNVDALFARAYYSGQYDYEDMARGFPWKNNDLFSKGRDGYEEVTK